MAIILSGTFQEPSPGIFIGGSDFSEFAGDVGAGWPAGLRSLGGGNLAILDESGVGEGIVVQQNDTNAGHMVIDAFSDIFQFGEILARVFIEDLALSNTRMKHGTGPLHEASAESTFVRMHGFNSEHRIEGWLITPTLDVALTSQLNDGVNPAGAGDFYFWLRVRFDDAGGGLTRIRFHTTYSTFDNPPLVPTTWDIDEVSSQAASQRGPWGTRLGWIRTTIGPTQISDRRLAFISFSTDPDNFPTPFPSEIIDPATVISPPTVTVDPLQDTWVGLKGSAFSLVTGPSTELLTIPAFLSDAIGAWEFTYHQANDEGQRAMIDLSGNGLHLYYGLPGQRDSVLGSGPFSGGKVGVVHGGEIGSRTLALDNANQQYNVGASGGKVRITMNFTMDLVAGTQTIVSHDGGITSKAWRWQVQNDSRINVLLTEDGSTDRGGLTSVGLNTVFSDWDDMWLRITYDFDADQITVETSSDGAAWTQLGTTIAFGANLASMFQPSASQHVWLGAENNGGANVSPGTAIYFLRAEEDTGSGFVETWSWTAANVTYASLAEGTGQGSTTTQDPQVIKNALRLALLSDNLATFFNTNVRAISDQLDVAAGEQLTVAIVAAFDRVNAGAAGSFVYFAHKNDDPLAQPGWCTFKDGATNGFDFRASDGADQDATPVAAIVDDFELDAMFFEIDGPGGEIRKHALAQTVEVGAYSDQGTGSPAEPFFVGRHRVGDLANMDFLGAAIFKRLLTQGEKQQLATFLSAGRL